MVREPRVNYKKLFSDRDLDFIDEAIPTRRRGINSIFSPGATAVVMAGSVYVTGSPSHMSRTLQVTKLRVSSGSPNCWFAIVHSRDGTIDSLYLEGKGEQTDIGDLMGPVLSLGPGTVKAYVLGPSNSTGTPPGFAGVGPGTPAGVNSYGVQLDGYEVGVDGAGA